MRRRAALLAFGIASAAWLAGIGTAGAAEICKWQDRSGGIHYDDVPSANGRMCLARIRVEHADPVERRRAEERRTRQSVWLAEQEKARSRSRDAETVRRQEEDARRARCGSALEELRFLREAEGMRLVRPSRQGEPEALDWLDARERDDLLAAWERQARAWCSGSGSAEAAPDRVHAVPAPPRRPVRTR
jgi:hypothetical protein